MVDTGFPIIGRWQAIQLRWRYTKANASAPATLPAFRVRPPNGHPAELVEMVRIGCERGDHRPIVQQI